MLGSADLVAFVPTRDPARARAFYEGVLGLRVTGADQFAVVLDANGVTVRVVNVSNVDAYVPAKFTILGWRVPSIEQAVRDLVERGVTPARFPGLAQDALGIWTAPGGARVAWFHDPDGNILSVSEE